MNEIIKNFSKIFSLCSKRFFHFCRNALYLNFQSSMMSNNTAKIKAYSLISDKLLFCPKIQTKFALKRGEMLEFLAKSFQLVFYKVIWECPQT